MTFFSIVSYCITLAVWPLRKPAEAAAFALPMASSFASFSMWPSLYWGRASRGFWQRQVPRTSQALTWLFLLLLFWMLLDHKRTQFSRQLHPTCHLKCSQWWWSNRAPARVQATLLRTGEKQYNEFSCQWVPSPAKDHRGEKAFQSWAMGPAPE